MIAAVAESLAPHHQPESGTFRLLPTQAPAAVSLPHLRGWLARFPPVADAEPCPICEGRGLLRCEDCGHVEECSEPCETETEETCWDCGGKPIAVAIVLGVRVRAAALLRRLARCRGATAIARVDRDGALRVGGSRPIPPHAPGAGEVVCYEAAYAHEQLPLRGLCA